MTYPALVVCCSSVGARRWWAVRAWYARLGAHVARLERYLLPVALLSVVAAPASAACTRYISALFWACDTQAEMPAGSRSGDMSWAIDTQKLLLWNGSAWVEVSGTGGGGASWGGITGTLSNQTDLNSALAGKAATSHTHAESDVTGLVSDLAGKVATTRSVATTAPLSGGGDLSADRTLSVAAATTTAVGVVELATSGESASGVVVQGNDSRLSDARTPLAHVHAAADITSGTLVAARGGLGAAQPTCSGGQFLTCNGTSCSCATPAGGSGPAVARKTADQSSTSTSFADVTGLTFSISASTNYRIECTLYHVTAVNTTALQVALNGPASPTAMRYSVITWTTATATHAGTQSAYDAVTNPATGAAAVSLPVLVRGTIENGGNAGTLALRMRTEVSTSSVTIQRGSSCTLTTLP